METWKKIDHPYTTVFGTVQRGPNTELPNTEFRSIVNRLGELPRGTEGYGNSEIPS